MPNGKPLVSAPPASSLSGQPISEESLADMCASARWQRLMLSELDGSEPAAHATQLLSMSERCFDQLSRADWLEAFAAHSTIGAPRPDDATGGREQAGLDGAQDELLDALAQANLEYRRRFGFVFLIRAHGRTGGEMLTALRTRLTNSPETEFASACAQQREITALRLQRLVATVDQRSGSVTR